MYLYEATDLDGFKYYFSDPQEIVYAVGKEVEITRYTLQDPLNVTDTVLGELWHELD